MGEFSVEDFFEIMGNEVRRKIIQSLARGPMSMRDLTSIIDVSRQAILKQIKGLEEKGFIVHEKEESEESRKGPNPHVYQLSQFFTLTYEMNPSYVRPRVVKLGLLPGKKNVQQEQVPDKFKNKPLKKCFDELIEYDRELEELVKEHKKKYQEKNELVRAIIQRIDATIDNQEEQNLLYYMLKFPKRALEGLTLNEVSRVLNLRKDFAEAVMNNLESLGLVESIGKGKLKKFSLKDIS